VPNNAKVDGSGTEGVELSVMVIVCDSKVCVPTLKNEDGSPDTAVLNRGPVTRIDASGGSISTDVQEVPTTTHVIGGKVVSVEIRTGLS
jgi:hypothetical protein